MKTKMILGLILAMIFSTQGAFATAPITVYQAQAKKLIRVLERAGATPHHQIEITTIHVKNLSCGEEGGFALIPMHCSFQDKVTGAEVTVNRAPVSNLLVDTLRAAGANVDEINRGELHKVSLTVRAIDCVVGGIHDSANCEIKQ